MRGLRAIKVFHTFSDLLQVSIFLWVSTQQKDGTQQLEPQAQKKKNPQRRAMIGPSANQSTWTVGCSTVIG